MALLSASAAANEGTNINQPLRKFRRGYWRMFARWWYVGTIEPHCIKFILLPDAPIISN